MNKITAVIVTKNEEKNIGRCLKSLKNVADEIIVVDSLSTDKTKAICESFPNVIFEQKDWQGYSQTKNYANSIASGDYILSLDADEEISPELEKELLDLKPQLNGHQAFHLNRLTNYCGKWIYHSGWLPDYQLRVFPRTGSQWDGAHVHEKILLSPSVRTTKLKGFLRHYSYYSINDHLERAKVYTSLGARKVLEKNEKFLLAKAVVNPFLRFIKTYFVQRGFQDGFYGFGLSMITAFTVFLKYFKAWQSKKYNIELK